MDFTEINAALLDFLDRSPVPFYAVRNMKDALEKSGFLELSEGERWELREGGAFYVCRNDSALIWAVIAAVFGLLFGPLMYLEYFAINGGWEMFFTMWVTGIPYDLAHCGGNFVLTLILYRPLYKVMERFLGTPAPHKTKE